MVLLAFFVSSSLLSTKQARRNERQVLANGGIAALAALTGNWTSFAGALAAANADTWATEIGRFSPTSPRLITNGARVPAGTDGGMTLLGTTAGIAGAGLIAALKNKGIQAVFHYQPLHSSAFYKKKHDGRPLPNCDRYADTLLRLPLFYELTAKQQDSIIACIKDFYAG